MRLTEKGTAMKNSLDEKENQVALMYNKLGQLEDIEDELGIDLITFSKALKNGIWFIETHGCISGPYQPLIAKEGPVLSLDYEFQYELNFNDYGKKEPMGWALTKEELL